MMKPDTTIYYGSHEDREVTVDGRTLDPMPSRELRNHSPDGFNWGYAGSGPAQLALAICLDFLGGDGDRAMRIYQPVKLALLVTLDQEQDFKFSGRQVREAIELAESRAA